MLHLALNWRATADGGVDAPGHFVTGTDGYPTVFGGVNAGFEDEDEVQNIDAFRTRTTSGDVRLWGGWFMNVGDNIGGTPVNETDFYIDLPPGDYLMYAGSIDQGGSDNRTHVEVWDGNPNTDGILKTTIGNGSTAVSSTQVMDAQGNITTIAGWVGTGGLPYLLSGMTKTFVTIRNRVPNAGVTSWMSHIRLESAASSSIVPILANYQRRRAA